ncbi:unnamed protein product [Ectocarpus sp. 4 AP-2014]
MSATEPTPGAQSLGSGAPEELLPAGGTEVPPLRQTAPTNPEAASLNFPEHVADAVKTAIIGFKPPAERAIASLEVGNKVNRSIINFYGVRLELLPLQEGRRRQEWACLASQACRASGKRLKIFSYQTSGATTHLKDAHGIGGATSAKSTKRKHDELMAKEETTPNVPAFYQDDPFRYYSLAYIKSFVIGAGIRISVVEDDYFRAFLSAFCADTFEVDRLTTSAVKKLIIEMYAATTRASNSTMIKDVRRALIPILYLDCDCWTSQISGQKYIGVRVCYMDENMIMKSFALATKLFRPKPTENRGVLGGAVKKWNEQVLDEHGLRAESFSGAVSGSGLEVSTGITGRFRRELSIPHLVNRAAIDGTGMSSSPASSKNAECRAMLKKAEKVIQLFNRSTEDKILFDEDWDDLPTGEVKLSQAVVQRWISICKMLLALLERWESLQAFYANKNEEFPLATLRTEFEEVHSIMSAVNNVAEYCQETYKATAEGGLSRIAVLLTDTLESNETLRVQHIPAVGAEVTDAASHTDRPHDCLTAIGMKTRVVFATAIARRFLCRYSSTCLNARTHLFDHTILLSPRFRKMKYIDLLLGSTAAKSCGDLADAPTIKSRIHSEIVTLLTKAVVEMRSRAAMPSEAEGVTGPQPRTPQAATRDAKRKRSTGFFDDSDSDREAEEGVSATTTPPRCSPKEEAKKILKEWLQQEIPKSERAKEGADYWRTNGKSQPLPLRAVAQAVFGCPAATGAMERDPYVTDTFVPPERSLTDRAFSEMSLLLRAQLDLIPEDVPRLFDEELRAAIPSRLEDEKLLEEVHVLEVDVEPPNDYDGEEYSDPEWVAFRGGIGGAAEGSIAGPVEDVFAQA